MIPANSDSQGEWDDVTTQQYQTSLVEDFDDTVGVKYNQLRQCFLNSSCMKQLSQMKFIRKCIHIVSKSLTSYFTYSAVSSTGKLHSADVPV